jgi:hypothetical protein
MKYFILMALLASCAPRPSNEMEAMTRDVLKAKSGIEIDVKPIPKDQGD